MIIFSEPKCFAITHNGTVKREVLEAANEHVFVADGDGWQEVLTVREVERFIVREEVA